MTRLIQIEVMTIIELPEGWELTSEDGESFLVTPEGRLFTPDTCLYWLLHDEETGSRGGLEEDDANFMLELDRFGTVEMRELYDLDKKRFEKEHGFRLGAPLEEVLAALDEK